MDLFDIVLLEALATPIVCLYVPRSLNRAVLVPGPVLGTRLQAHCVNRAVSVPVLGAQFGRCCDADSGHRTTVH